MKLRTAVSALIIIATAVGAAQAPRASYVHYEGTMLRGAIPIAADLLFEGSTCEGSYYRKDRGAWAILQGTKAANGGMTLIERNGEGQEIARFMMRRFAEGEYKGTWRGTLEGDGDRTTVDVYLAEARSGAASLSAVKQESKEYAFRSRRGRNAPAAEAVYVGPEARALSYGSSGEAIAALKKNLLRFMCGDTDHVETGLAQFWKSSRAEYLREYRDVVAEAAELPEYALQWSDISRAYVRLNECYLLVVENTSYTFRGGAHGVYASSYGVFDLHTGARITRNDLFLPTAEAALRPMLKRRILEMLTERTGEPASDDDIFVEGEFPVTDNIFLRRDGVGFHYNVYEVSYYAAGDFDVVFTWDELKGMLRTNTPAARLLPGAPQGDAR